MADSASPRVDDARCHDVAGRPWTVSDFVQDAVAQRLEGDEPSRMRALGAAIMIGAGAAVLAYRLLRSSGGDDRGSDD
jgi:hypothetical protein